MKSHILKRVCGLVLGIALGMALANGLASQGDGGPFARKGKPPILLPPP